MPRRLTTAMLMAALMAAAATVRADPAPASPGPRPPAHQDTPVPTYPARLSELPDLQGNGWGLRSLDLAPGAGQQASLFGPLAPSEFEAGYLWGASDTRAVLGFSQLDMGPRSENRTLGAPNRLRPPGEDRPGVLGAGLMIRTR
jgi:hypothetical protein